MGAEAMVRAGAEDTGRGAGADVKAPGFVGGSDDFDEWPSRFDDI
jgi:hypothetical protein